MAVYMLWFKIYFVQNSIYYWCSKPIERLIWTFLFLFVDSVKSRRYFNLNYVQYENVMLLNEKLVCVIVSKCEPSSDDVCRPSSSGWVGHDRKVHKKSTPTRKKFGVTLIFLAASYSGASLWLILKNWHESDSEIQPGTFWSAV